MSLIRTESAPLGYIAFFNSKRLEVYAASALAAKIEAVKLFKAPKSKQHLVSVHLAERADGSAVVHVADF